MSRFPRRFAFLAAVVSTGAIAAIVIPRDTRASQDGSGPTVREMLYTIRTQIELYSVQNPALHYDAGTATITFWDPLVQGGYLPAEPANPLQKGSTLVGATPHQGFGWVWAEAPPGDSWTLNLYAVDENGNYYDGDGNGSPD